MRRTSVSLTSLIILASCTSATPDPGPSPASSLEVSGTYEVFPATVQFGDSPKATLRNTGDIPLEYGLVYNVEFLVDGEWIDISQPEESEPVCAFPLVGFVLHPGATRTQRIRACDTDGASVPFAPGSYRVLKRVTAIDEGLEPEDIELTARFAVAEPMGPVPAPSACRVLCMSDTTVRSGDTVTVDLDPHRRYTWGAGSQLHFGSTRTATPIAFLIGWPRRDKELTTCFSGDVCGVEDIGFVGLGRWQWKVPKSLEPGIYAIAKDGIRGRPGSAPMHERRRFWSVAFEVVNQTAGDDR